MDGTHIGEYYDNENCHFSTVVWKIRPVNPSSFYIVIHRNCQFYNVIKHPIVVFVFHIYLYKVIKKKKGKQKKKKISIMRIYLYESCDSLLLK